MDVVLFCVFFLHFFCILKIKINKNIDTAQYSLAVRSSEEI